MNKSQAILLLVILSLITVETRAQFTATNISEVQMGNLPDESPSDMVSFFDQLAMKYKYKRFRFSAKIDQYHSSVENPYEYISLSQLTGTYRKRGLEINAGNFYETLGNGLLLRGYEIKNSIFEDRIYRSKQGFYRDILGGSVNYRYKNLNVKAVSGQTLNNQLPQKHPERRIDWVNGAEINYTIGGQTLGGIYLNHLLNNNSTNLASILLSGDLLNAISYRAELARNIGDEIVSFSDNDQYGAYFSMNYAISGFGFSFELKDYNNFIVGSGIADAPTLVKQHSYRLLNRSTHVAEFLNETGYQFEMFISANDWFLTLNHAYAKNNFGNTEFYFHEFFVEANLSRQGYSLKTFVDYSKDEVKDEYNRWAIGSYFTKQLKGSWSLNIETEAQYVERTDHNYTNLYLGFFTSMSTKFSAGLIYEATNDPFVVEKGEFKNYPSVNINYRINRKNNISLFAGKRRGGPACASGICYEVLDFEGVELRYTFKI